MITLASNNGLDLNQYEHIVYRKLNKRSQTHSWQQNVATSIKVGFGKNNVWHRLAQILHPLIHPIYAKLLTDGSFQLPLRVRLRKHYNDSYISNPRYRGIQNSMKIDNFPPFVWSGGSLQPCASGIMAGLPWPTAWSKTKKPAPGCLFLTYHNRSIMDCIFISFFFVADITCLSKPWLCGF